MSSDLSRLIQSLSFIDIVGESMIPSHSDKEGSTDKIYDVLVSIRNLKNQMQQELLHTQQFGNPEQILDFSFEELSEIYIELIMTQLPQNLRVNKPERQDFRSYITSLKNTISLDPRNPILIFAKIVSDYYVLLDYVGAIKFNFERLPPNFMDEAAAAKSDDTKADSESKVSETEESSADKFLGMPKKVGIAVVAVGGLALLVGGFFLIKKMRK